MDLSDKPHFLNNAYHHHRQSLITLINFRVRPFHFLSQDPLHHTLVDKGAAHGILHFLYIQNIDEGETIQLRAQT